MPDVVFIRPGYIKEVGCGVGIVLKNMAVCFYIDSTRAIPGFHQLLMYRLFAIFMYNLNWLWSTITVLGRRVYLRYNFY